jgi:opine dehydrogenase
MKYVIIGAGNCGLSVMAMLQHNNSQNDVVLITSRAKTFPENFIVNHHSLGEFKTQAPENVTSEYTADIINNADIILICAPLNSHDSILENISKVFVHKNQIISSICGCGGFDTKVKKYLGENIPLFAFQRVPYISRASGSVINVLGDAHGGCKIGHKNVDNPYLLCFLLARDLKMQVRELTQFTAVTLGTSNPILHLSRIVTNQNIHEQFYSDWTDAASKITIACSDEVAEIAAKIGLVKSDNCGRILQHYDAHDRKSLTRKIQSIEAYKGIFFPLNDEKTNIDSNSRYLTEDSLSLDEIVKIGDGFGVDLPVLKRLQFDVAQFRASL